MTPISRVRLRGDGTVAYDSVPGPLNLEAGDLLIQPDVVGVCATDIEIRDGSLIYYRDGVARYPITPGHEWTGTVLALGEGVRAVQPGDRVIGQPHVGCGECLTCRTGSPHLCPNRREGGVMNLDGALASQMVYPARCAHRVNNSVHPEDAVFGEPIAIAVRALKRLDAESGPVLVVGVGPIGSLIAMVSLAWGWETHVHDLRPGRLLALQSLGAHVDGQVSAFRSVVDASGSPHGLRYACCRLAIGGRVVAVGLTGVEEVPVSIDGFVVREQSLVGSLGSEGAWPEAIRLLNDGQLRPSALVSHRFGFDDYADALSLVASRSDDVCKAVIRMPDLAPDCTDPSQPVKVAIR